MAKREYRMIAKPGSSTLLPAALVTDGRYLIVRRKGAAPFVVSKADWAAAPISESENGG